MNQERQLKQRLTNGCARIFWLNDTQIHTQCKRIITLWPCETFALTKCKQLKCQMIWFAWDRMVDELWFCPLMNLLNLQSKLHNLYWFNRFQMNVILICYSQLKKPPFCVKLCGTTGNILLFFQKKNNPFIQTNECKQLKIIHHLISTANTFGIQFSLWLIRLTHKMKSTE